MAMGYRVKFAGARKGLELASVARIDKGKAMPTKKEAERRGEAKWWEGTDGSDTIANKARAITDNEKQWLATFKKERANLSRRPKDRPRCRQPPSR